MPSAPRVRRRRRRPRRPPSAQAGPSPNANVTATTARPEDRGPAGVREGRGGRAPRPRPARRGEGRRRPDAVHSGLASAGAGGRSPRSGPGPRPPATAPSRVRPVLPAQRSAGRTRRPGRRPPPSALRTTTGLRITSTGRNRAVGGGPTRPRRARRAPRARRRPPRHRSGRRRLHEQHHPGGGRRHQGRAEQVEAGAASLGGHPAPQQRSISAPSIGSAMTARQPSSPSIDAAGERAQAATAAAKPATRPSARRARRPRSGRLTMATPRVGTAAAPAPWTIRAPRRTPKFGASAPASAPVVIRPTPTTQGEPQPDQVGDPAVDGGRHGEHQRVEADRPGAHTDADAEVGADHGQGDRRRGATEPGETEEQADQHGHARVLPGAGRRRGDARRGGEGGH